jgi:hypothetical protein
MPVTAQCGAYLYFRASMLGSKIINGQWGVGQTFAHATKRGAMLLLIVSPMAFLAACGGGGGGPATTPPPASQSEALTWDSGTWDNTNWS